MTDYTPILSLPQVASNQEQKEATINTAIAILEAAMNDTLAVDLSAGNLTLNTDQFTKYFLLQFQGHTAARTVTVPATQRWFAIENQGSASVTLKCAGSTGLVAELPSGKIGLIVSDGVDLRFVVPDAVNGMGLLADLSDVSGVPTNNQLLRWNATQANWMPWTLNLAFSQLSDNPGAYISYPGSLLAVKADGSGLEWVTSAANINSFIDLNDTPGSYSGAANRAVRVNNAGTGLVFATPTLRENSDFPANYTGAAGKFVQVNPAANGVQFAFPKLSDLSDGPGQPAIGDALRFLRVNAAGTALEFVPGAGGPVNFTELLDTPGSFAGAANRVVRVGPDADKLIYSVLKLSDLSDFPATYSGQGNKWLRVNGAQTGVTFADPKVIDLSDGPGSFAGNAKKFVRVNASSNALEYYAARLTDLADFPAAFTGQGGKFLQVRPGEDGVRFVSSSFSAAFLDLTDTPDLYSGQAGKFVQVNPAGDGLIFASAAVNLNDLLDVDVDTNPAVPGSVLTYRDGAWTAEALPAIATNLNALTDVDLTTGTPGNGNVLTYRDGAWTAEPAAAAGVTYLASLLDVDFGSGEPAEGMSLVYRSGAWSAETLATGGGSATTLGELNDVDLSTGTPSNGQVLTYNNGAWTAEDVAEGGFTIPPEFGAHSRWRVLVDARDNVGASERVGVGRLEFRASAGGPQQALGGVTQGTPAVAGTTATGAFDNDVTTAWGATFVAGETHFGYYFLNPVTVQEIAIQAPDPYFNSIVRPAPTSFRVQYSDDGTNWFTAWTVTDSIGWAPTETRVFAPPAVPGIAFRTLDDTPSTYIGQGGKALRVALTESGIEFYTPTAPTLNSLTDVDVDTTPAANGNVLTYRDGAWTAEAPASTVESLDDVTDVILTTPASGEVLTYREGVWVNETATAAGVPSYGAYAYWRLLLHTTDGGPRFGVQELEFKRTKTGGDLANGGTPFASSQDGVQSVDGAFDNIIGGRWDSVTANDGEFIGYHFVEPVGVRYVTIKGAQDTPNLSPASFSVQYSEDGVTYTTAWEVTGQTGWAAGQTREFHGLLDLYFTDLADVPQSFVGQAGKSLRVNAGGTALELYTPAAPTTALNDLTDVDVDTTPAVAGSVLTYRDGAWTAEVIPAQSLNSLSDVDTSTGTPTNGSVLTYNDGAWTAEPAQTVAVPDVALDDLTDVSIIDPTEGDVIVYRGGQWVSANLSGDYGAHAYWRVLVTQTVDGNASNPMINNLAFRAAPGAPTLTTGGTPIASSGTPANAYDDSSGGNTLWQSTSSLPQWLGYQFVAPVSVVEIAITASNVQGWAQAYLPRDFKVQYSDNGTTWFDAWAVTGDAVYNANEVRTHTSPGVFSTFLGNADTPDTYVGQGGKTVRVKADGSGLEFVTVSASGSLNDLSDVDTSTGTPVPGSVLTYINGAWSAELPASSGAAKNYGKVTATSNSTWTQGYAGGNRVAMAEGDKLHAVAFEPATTVANVQVRALLYADNAGVPGALLASSDVVTGVVASTPKVVPLQSIYTAGVGGALVWVCIQTTTANFQMSDHAGASRYWSDGDLTPFNPAPSTSAWATAWNVYGVGTASALPNLNALTDVDLTTGTPANGSVLTYRDGAWTAEEPASGVGTEVPVGGKHAYWRLNLISSQGSAYGIAKLAFAAVLSGADQATGGAPLSTNDYTAGGVTYDRFKAFDNDSATFWASNDVAASTIGYQFTSPVAVGEIRLTTRPSGGFGAHGPTAFDIQWSDDGTTWTSAWSATSPSTWVPGETRTFVAPVETIPLNLSDLGDVDLTVAPVEDQVLTFVDGEWVAANPPQRARNRGPFGDTSVYLKRTFEDGLPAGFENAASALWTVVSNVDAPYSKALRSHTIGPNGVTQFNFDVNATPACSQLRVRYKVASESNFDKFRIYVDGVEKTSVSGNTGLYATETIALTPGLRTITFHYSKDASGDVGTDDVLIPYVEFAYAGSEPYIVGDIVTHEGATYQSLVDGAIEEPGTGDDWSALGGGGAVVGVLDDLTDVEIVDATNGDVLTYDDGVWKAQPAGGSISLGDLTLTHGAALPTAAEPSGSLYLQDEAGDGFIADTVVATGPEVVQSGTSTEIAANHVVTMPQAPTPGNWLVAFISTNGGIPAWQPGWTQFKSVTGAYISVYMARRLAEIGDTAVLTPSTGNSGADPVTIFEVEGLGSDWAAVFDEAYAIGDSTAGGAPFNGAAANHTITGPHGFGLAVICQRATQPTASPAFTGDWTPAATYSNIATNRQTGSGILVGRTTGQSAAMTATVSSDLTHYGFGAVYFKTAQPYGNGTDIAWNRIMLEDRAEIADLADVSETAASSGQVLTWNVTTQKWEPKTPSGGLSGVGEPTLEAPIGSLYLRTDEGQAWVAASAAVDLTKVVYAASGARQSFTVGPGITSLKVKMWGAAGGGGVYSGNQGNSGAGGYTLANVPVAEGDVIDIDVGQGGGGAQPGTAGGLGGWPDGGYGGRGDVTCAGGGGSSRIWKNTVLMAVAGGGGGGTGYSSAAGAGGGSSGESSANGGGGSGGSQLAGGVDLSETSNLAKRGGYLQGGAGTNHGDRFISGNDDGGGGGGGYYGGGGGGGDGITGGGGSGYLNVAAGVTGLLQGGAGIQPPQTGDADYAFGIAGGVQGSSNGVGVAPSGGDGRVVVQPETTDAAWQRLAFMSDLGGVDNIGLENATLSSGEGAPTAGLPKGSLYINETTGQVYQSGGVTGDITVVQSKLKGSNVSGSEPTTVTLTSAPAAGNWLICLFGYKSGVSAAPGWTLHPGAPSAGTEVNPGFAYKKVGVGESAAQTPYLATQRHGAAVMYELSGGGDDFSKILGAVSWQDDTTWTTATDDKGTPMSCDLASLGFMLAVQKPWYTGISLDAPWATGGSHTQAIGDDRAFIAGTLTALPNATITPDASKTSELQSAYTAVLIKSSSQAIWAPYKPGLSIDDLTDVVLGTTTEGKVLTYSSGQWRAVDPVRDDLITITTLTADRVLTLADRTSALRMNAATDTVVTVPLNSAVAIPVGVTVTIQRLGGGTVAIQPAAGVTIQYPIDVEPFLRAQYSVASLLKTATDTWVLFGDLLPS